MKYRITSDSTELARGSRIHIRDCAVKGGDLVAAKTSRDIIIVGRYFPGFIIQPHRWIECDKAVRILGRVVPVGKEIANAG